jgi:HK97 family phage major capsid protein
MDPKFEKDLLEVFKKHGLKADDVESSESDDEEPKKEEEGEETPPESEETPSEGKDSVVVAGLAASIAKKLADAIGKNKGYGEQTKKDLDTHIRHKIFTSWAGLREIEYPSDLTSLSKEEKIVTFFKALVYSNAHPESQQVLRALVEGTSTEGGYLVPEELRTEVFRVLPDMAVMRRIARVLPMSTNILKLNSLSARPVAYWTSEYQSKSTTSAEFGQVTLSPNDLVCLLPISEQLLADANINLVSFIVELFAEAIALAEDKAFFTGTGVGQPRGISIETIASQAVAGATISFDDILAVIDRVPQRVAQSPKAAFCGHRYVKRLLRTLKDTSNNYIWRDARGGVGGGGEIIRLPDTIYGYPFYEQNDLNQTELYFGDWSFYIIADRQTLAVKTTTEGGDAWRRNSIEIKAVERVDGRAVILSPFAKLTGI